MSIKIGQYDFEGPYFSTERLRDQSGIYAILSPQDGKFSVIDLGQASKVKSAVESDARISCWKKNCAGDFMVSAYYTPALQQDGRVEIELEIRKQYEPPCGNRRNADEGVSSLRK